jgi:hypothetical protein
MGQNITITCPCAEYNIQLQVTQKNSTGQILEIITFNYLLALNFKPISYRAATSLSTSNNPCSRLMCLFCFLYHIPIEKRS